MTHGKHSLTLLPRGEGDVSGIQKLFLPRSEEDDVAESAFSSSKGRKKREEEGRIDWNKFAKRERERWMVDR